MDRWNGILCQCNIIFWDQITIAGSPYTTEEFNKLNNLWNKCEKSCSFCRTNRIYSKYKNLNLKSLGYSTITIFKIFLPLFSRILWIHSMMAVKLCFDLLEMILSKPGAISCMQLIIWKWNYIRYYPFGNKTQQHITTIMIGYQPPCQGVKMNS